MAFFGEDDDMVAFILIDAHGKDVVCAVCARRLSSTGVTWLMV